MTNHDTAGEPDAPEAPEAPEAPRSPAGQRRRFKPRDLDTADGGTLRLHADGTIEHLDEAGTRLESWATGDPDWARHAIRFGLRPQPGTVAPHGGPDSGSKPPRW